MLELEHGFRVVDVHARLDEDEDAVERGHAVSPERLEREMHQAGVVRSVVFPGPREEGYVAANNAVARGSVERPFVAFARIGGPRSPDESAGARIRNLAARRKDHHTTPGEIEQYGYDDRFHGFVIDPGEDGLPDAETMDELESVGLPVLVHGGQSFPPAALEATFLERSIPIIFAGFGGFPLDRDLMDQAIDLLDRHDDLYLDTSFVRYRDPLERALMEHPDRVLFGSGAPATHPAVGVMEILALNVSEDKMRRAFSDNAVRVIEPLAPETET